MTTEQEQEWKIRKLEAVKEALIRQMTMMMQVMTRKDNLEICNFITEIVEEVESGWEQGMIDANDMMMKGIDPQKAIESFKPS